MEVHWAQLGKTLGEVSLDSGEDSKVGHGVGVADHVGEDQAMVGAPWMAEIRGEVEIHEEDHIHEVGDHCVDLAVKAPHGGHEMEEDHRGDQGVEGDPPGDEAEGHHGKMTGLRGRGAEDRRDSRGAPLETEGSLAREEGACGEEA